MVQSSSGLNGDSDPRGRGESGKGSGGCGGGIEACEAVASLEIITLEPGHVQRDSSRRLATAGRVKRSEK